MLIGASCWNNINLVAQTVQELNNGASAKGYSRETSSGTVTLDGFRNGKDTVELDGMAIGTVQEGRNGVWQKESPAACPEKLPTTDRTPPQAGSSR